MMSSKVFVCSVLSISVASSWISLASLPCVHVSTSWHLLYITFWSCSLLAVKEIVLTCWCWKPQRFLMFQLPKKSMYIPGSRGTCIVKDQAGSPVVTEIQILAALGWRAEPKLRQTRSAQAWKSLSRCGPTVSSLHRISVGSISI